MKCARACQREAAPRDHLCPQCRLHDTTASARCFRSGCSAPVTRYTPGDSFAKCEAHHTADVEQPWGSVERLPVDVTRRETAKLRRVK